MILCTTIMIFLVESNVLMQTLQIFQCRSLGDDPNKDLNLSSDVTIECWDSSHLNWVFAIALPSLLIC